MQTTLRPRLPSPVFPLVGSRFNIGFDIRYHSKNVHQRQDRIQYVQIYPRRDDTMIRMLDDMSFIDLLKLIHSDMEMREIEDLGKSKVAGYNLFILNVVVKTNITADKIAAWINNRTGDPNEQMLLKDAYDLIVVGEPTGMEIGAKIYKRSVNMLQFMRNNPPVTPPKRKAVGKQQSKKLLKCVVDEEDVQDEPLSWVSPVDL